MVKSEETQTVLTNFIISLLVFCHLLCFINKAKGACNRTGNERQFKNDKHSSYDQSLTESIVPFLLTYCAPKFLIKRLPKVSELDSNSGQTYRTWKIERSNGVSNFLPRALSKSCDVYKWFITKIYAS